MDDYRWYEFIRSRPENRFPRLPWLIGQTEWSIGVGQLLGRQPAPFNVGWAWVERLCRLRRSRRFGHRRPQCPRLFVSHQRRDHAKARRIAWLACQAGFDYWLDVIDLDPLRNPQVMRWQRYLGRMLTKHEIGVLTASIIEMALINCTHALALITPNTTASKWVPYEYGRVKDGGITSMQVACWRHPSIALTDLAEYLHLGAVNDSEPQITTWLAMQRAQYVHCVRQPDFADSWIGLVPQPLPDFAA